MKLWPYPNGFLGHVVLNSDICHSYISDFNWPLLFRLLLLGFLLVFGSFLSFLCLLFHPYLDLIMSLIPLICLNNHWVFINGALLALLLILSLCELDVVCTFSTVLVGTFHWVVWIVVGVLWFKFLNLTDWLPTYYVGILDVLCDDLVLWVLKPILWVYTEIEGFYDLLSWPWFEYCWGFFILLLQKKLHFLVPKENSKGISNFLTSAKAILYHLGLSPWMQQGLYIPAPSLLISV